ncbi:hypothetical protein [Clostridium sp. BNL1100]|uniref:hypothetical protein n=1 Tax=Clostridium sp. BNL1100 TaxID=755731 RepID=UPI00024A7852|nr:hypothetical protein [Clostridium sp. BNL1100]AEY67381.1 hypothetical protein Clo1100_3234 [Clostridium sp. BNL1100]
MNKKLDINADMFSKKSLNMLPLFILNDDLFINGWIYNHYIKFTICKDEISFSDNDFFLNEGVFIRTSYCFPIGTMNTVCIPKDLVLETLKGLIDDEQYLTGIFDKGQLQLNNNIFTDNELPFLIYGYDEEEQCFLAIIFINRQYEKINIRFEKICESIVAKVNGVVDGRILINSYGSNKLFQKTIDMEKILIDIKDLLKDSNGNDIDGVKNYINNRISNDLVDDYLITSTNTVLDHITFMYDRLKYIFGLTKQNIKISTLSDEIIDLISDLKKTIDSLYINIKLSENDKIYYIQKFTDILNKEKDIIYEICLNLSGQ